jgi:hypothetical protein
METKKIKLDFEMQFTDIVDLNKSFAKAKCLIAYCGRNRNYSDISKEVFIDALPSIKNIPIVARYDADKDDFGGHDIRIVEKDGEINIENATVPFGVVPESANQWFEEQLLPTGEKKDCLYTDVILWKRQFGYEHIIKSGKVSQSMEINVSSYIVDSDGYCIVEKMEWEALTLLGSDVEPCFENASLQVYSKNIISDFKLQYSQMLKELKQLNQSSNLEVDIDYLSKGGTSMEENKETVEEVVIDTTDQTTDKFIAEEKDTVDDDVVTEISDETNEDKVTDNETVEKSDEKTTDFSNELKELQGKYDNLLKEFDEYKTNYSTPNADVEELITYKNNKLAEERKITEESVFAKYEEKIGDTTEFIELKANVANYSIDALEKECIFIVGLHTEFAKETKKQEKVKFSVEKNTEEESTPYGGLFKTYLNK